MSEVKGVTEVNGIKAYKYFAGGERRSAEMGANSESFTAPASAHALS